MPVVATVLGRGHSGTRGIAGWLQDAGFSIGPSGQVNGTNDYATRQAYEAAEIAGTYATRLGHHQWCFDRLISGPIDAGWIQRMHHHLKPVYEAAVQLSGKSAWKLPECALMAPWIARAYPEIRLLIVHRDPRDLLLKQHGTDDIANWGVPVSREGLVLSGLEKRIESWKYQTDLLLKTTEVFPEQVMAFRLFDYVHDHDTVRSQASKFLDVPMPEGRVKTGPVGRHKKISYSGSEVEVIEAALGDYCPFFDGGDPGPFRHVPSSAERLEGTQ